MRSCKKCGAEIKGDKKVCPKCGTPVPKNEDKVNQQIDNNQIDIDVEDGEDYKVISTERQTSNIALYVIIGILCVVVVILGFTLFGDKKNGDIPVNAGVDNSSSSSVADNIESIPAETTADTQETTNITTYTAAPSDSVAQLETTNQNIKVLNGCDYLGKNISEIITMYGENYSTRHYEGGSFLYYADQSTSIPYSFSYGEGDATIEQDNVVNQVLVTEKGANITSELCIGMSFDEVSKITGTTVDYSVDQLSGSGYVALINSDNYMITLTSDESFIINSALISLPAQETTDTASVSADLVTIDSDGMIASDGSAVNVRSDASTESDILGTLDNNSYVWVMKQKGTWYYIKTETADGTSIEGYVSGDYVVLK